MKQRDFVTALKFVSVAMAKQDVRYYLNGVCVERTDGVTTLVATNGHMIAAIEVPDCDVPDGRHILHHSFVEAVLKNYKSRPKTEDNLSLVIEEMSVTVKGWELSMSAKLVDGTYPNWRSVLPPIDRKKGVAKKWLKIGFNPDYLMAFAKASKILTMYGLTLEVTTENDKAMIEIPIKAMLNLKNARGAIMPMKND